MISLPAAKAASAVGYSAFSFPSIRIFGGDPAVVGREVTINSVPMTIVGVTPPDFVGSFLGINTSAWVPMAMQAEMTGGSRLEARGSGWMQTLVRLRPSGLSTVGPSRELLRDPGVLENPEMVDARGWHHLLLGRRRP